METKDLIGKEFNYSGKTYRVESFCMDELHGIECLYLSALSVEEKKGRKPISPAKLSMPVKNISMSDKITSDDEDLMKLSRQEAEKYISKQMPLAQRQKEDERQRRLSLSQSKEEERKAFLEKELELGRKQGTDDARGKKSALYRIFSSTEVSYINNVKKNQYTKEFRDAYMTAYEDESIKLKKQRLVATRANQSTLDDYPGNLKELISWMRKNLLRIEVFASPDKIDNEQKALDCINERDNTNYEVKLRQGQYVAYEAFFRNPKSAPQEFIDWMVSKHDYTTADLDKRVMAHPMNIETGKMTCNSIIKELVYSSEYGFHVGKASN